MGTSIRGIKPGTFALEATINTALSIEMGMSYTSFWASLVTATVEDAEPTKVVMTFTLANTSLVAADFTVTDKTVSTLTRDATNKILTLTLTEAVVYGDVMTVTMKLLYTHAVTNNVSGAVAPVFVSAAIAHATPTKVDITFDLALNESSIPATTDFALTGKTITNVAISGMVVTLTVSVTYDYGDVVTVGYTKPGANMLKGLVGGGEVDTFSGESVTNNILYPVVIGDGNTVTFYDSQLLSTITKDGSNFVSRWNDRLLSGHDLFQSTGSFQPLWSVDGILFDGIDNCMKATAFTLIQPEFIYMVVKQVTWTKYDYFFDGNTADSGIVYQGEGITPRINAGAGLYLGDNANLVLNTWGILRVLFNGASSKLIVNATTPTTGNCGTGNMGGFTLGSRAVGLYYSNIHVKEIIIRKIADTSGDETAIYNYLAAKYGI
jgi:hypothetical protein